MSPPDPLDTWVLTFTRARGHGEAPTCVRVRRLLKCALRSFGLKCVKVSGPPVGFPHVMEPPADKMD